MGSFIGGIFRGKRDGALIRSHERLNTKYGFVFLAFGEHRAKNLKYLLTEDRSYC